MDLYANGEIPELCDKLTAALGKIDVEAAELKAKGNHGGLGGVLKRTVHGE